MSKEKKDPKEEQGKKTIFKPKTIIIVILIIVVTIFLLKNSENDNIEHTDKESVSVSESQEQLASQNPSYPSSPGLDVQFMNGNGEKVSLAELKGKVVFINFWATWCPPCISEMPSINNLYLQYKNDPNIVFLMVDMDNNYQNSSAFMKKKGYELPVHTPSSEIPQAFFAGSLPTTVILDKKGQIVANQVGAADFNDPGVTTFLNDLIQ